MVNRYDKVILSKDNQDTIDRYTTFGYHDGAEAIRNRHGYSSGAMGADFIPMNPTHYMYDNQLREICLEPIDKHISKKKLRARLKELKSLFYGNYQIFYKTIHFYQVKLDELAKENHRLKQDMISFWSL